MCIVHTFDCAHLEVHKNTGNGNQICNLRNDKGVVVLQSLKVSHLSVWPNRFYKSPKLKNWMCELRTFSQIHSQLCLCMCMHAFISSCICAPCTPILRGYVVVLINHPNGWNSSSNILLSGCPCTGTLWLVTDSCKLSFKLTALPDLEILDFVFLNIYLCM